MRPITNPPNPFESQYREFLEPAPWASVEIYEDAARQILSRNDSPDLSFRWSVNPYRGCFHACAYCYARPTHEYWGFGAGTDFDTKLIMKPNAAALLRQAFVERSWRGEVVVFSGNTDCYQPLEATYRLTRACLEVCAEFRNPVAIITKSALVLRDLDILRELHRHAWLRVYVSIPFLDTVTARRIEPGAPSPDKRFRTLRALSGEGLRTGVSLAPIIPGLNEHDIPRLVRRAKASGATDAFMSLIRLPGNTEATFAERLQEAFPDRADKVFRGIRRAREGPLSTSRFFERHKGRDAAWDTSRRLFEIACRIAGLAPSESAPIPSTFQRPTPDQLALF
ncbi:radical SAM protein [Nitrospira sp.]|nr:radical SAM protein [Nitrospira sp.]